MVMRKYKIANYVVELDYPKEFIAPEMDLYECSGNFTSDIYWTVVKGTIKDELPEKMAWNSCGKLKVGECKGSVYVIYPNRSYYKVDAVIYENNFKKVTYYVRDGLQPSQGKKYIQEMGKYLFMMHQEAFVLALTLDGAVPIHSSALVYDNQGIIFASEVHSRRMDITKLWNVEFGTPLLSQGLTICKVEHDRALLYGAPWGGTAVSYRNQAIECKCIVFEEQDELNWVYRPDTYDSYQRLYDQTLTPTWYQQLKEWKVHNILTIIKSKIPCIVLACKRDLSAVTMIKHEIDHLAKDGEITKEPLVG